MKIGYNSDGYKKWTFAQMYIMDLIELTQYDKKLLLSTQDIAQKTGHSYARVSQVLKSLEKGDYIKKIKNFNPEDQRKKYWCVSWTFERDLETLNYYNYDKFIRSFD